MSGPGFHPFGPRAMKIVAEENRRRWQDVWGSRTHARPLSAAPCLSYVWAS